MKKGVKFRDMLPAGMRVIIIKGRPYMYTPERINPETVPKDMYMYSLRHSGNDMISEICEGYVLANYYGTIVGQDPICMTNGSYVPRVQEYSFTQKCVKTTAQWRQAYVSIMGAGAVSETSFADIALIGKRSGVLMSSKETGMLLNKLCRTNAYPIEVAGNRYGRKAMGYITLDADKKIRDDAKQSDLFQYIADLIDNKQPERGVIIKDFDDLVIWMQV